MYIQSLLLLLFICGLITKIFIFMYSIYQIIPGSKLTSNMCYFCGVFALALYNMFKFLIYCALLYRVYESYKGGIMAYSNQFFVIIGTISNAKWYSFKAETADKAFDDEKIIQEEFDEIKIVDDPRDINPFGFV